ncbi:hypothetical protein, partial [Xanthobacter versatilis]|uniref:hypothetical protein n=1 Tax=Xanthobacter autotrophicus (strain ATCC BAA-1158 / Py2) TaxID=78245 RepID=UPI00372A4717
PSRHPPKAQKTYFMEDHFSGGRPFDRTAGKCAGHCMCGFVNGRHIPVMIHSGFGVMEAIEVRQRPMEIAGRFREPVEWVLSEAFGTKVIHGTFLFQVLFHLLAQPPKLRATSTARAWNSAATSAFRVKAAIVSPTSYSARASPR